MILKTVGDARGALDSIDPDHLTILRTNECAAAFYLAQNILSEAPYKRVQLVYNLAFNFETSHEAGSVICAIGPQWAARLPQNGDPFYKLTDLRSWLASQL